MPTASIRSFARHGLICVVASLALSACGGGGGSSAASSGSGSGSGSSTSTLYSIGGSVSGLSASGLVLTDNGGNNLSLASGASSFTFSTELASGSSYAVAVATQPTGETCSVSAGSGTVATANVTAISVKCTVNTYPIGGDISGLSQSGLVLTDNGGDNLTVPSGATTFTFSTALDYGASYSVAVATQPTGETCSVSSGSGTVSGAVSSVKVACVLDTFAVGGSVSGLTASGLVLQNNGSDNLSVPSGAGTFSFSSPLSYGASYHVSVYAQPTGETCTVANGTGTVSAVVTSVVVACSVNTYTVSGTVTGLTSAGLKLLDYTGGETISVAGGASTFAFTQSVPYGTNIDVTMSAQPAWETCTAGRSNFSGPIVANVTNESFSCATKSSAAVSTLAGSTTGGNSNGTGSLAAFNQPDGIAIDPLNGDIIVADSGNNEIREITTAGVVTTLAGSATAGHADGAATTATFNQPEGVAVDSNGNVFVADKGNNEIREISAGTVSTFAGSLTAGSADGTGAAASFNKPEGLAFDSKGNLYVADSANNEIRMITPAGVVSTLAGSTVPGNADGTGAAAQFDFPTGVAVDSAGNVYVADSNNEEIRKITPAGVVSTLAGSSNYGSANGTGSAAQFWVPLGVAVDAEGNVYVADSLNNDIRLVTPTGVVSTLTGQGPSGNGSTDGALSVATFNGPGGVVVDASGNLYVSDSSNNEIRKVTQ